MSRNHIVKFAVSENEWELLQANARICQIRHISTYVRHVALGRDAELEARLIENNKLLAKLCKRLKIAGMDRDTATFGGRGPTRSEKTNDQEAPNWPIRTGRPERRSGLTG